MTSRWPPSSFSGVGRLQTVLESCWLWWNLFKRLFSSLFIFDCSPSYHSHKKYKKDTIKVKHNVYNVDTICTKLTILTILTMLTLKTISYCTVEVIWKQYLTMASQISKTLLTHSLINSPIRIQEMVAHLKTLDNPSSGGVKHLHVPSQDIWLPDIVLYNK